ncbi:MAG: CopG family transcriptional regulator [Demequina sp.]
MAMTVRMTAEQDAMVTALAKRWGVSKNEAILRAVEESASEQDRSREVGELSREMIDRWGPVLDRLGTV